MLDKDGKIISNTELIEKVTGINKTEQKKIMENIKSNRKQLESCNKHDFSIDTTPDKTYNKKYQCTKCGGVVSWQEKHWYELGLKHSKTI